MASNFCHGTRATYLLETLVNERWSFYYQRDVTILLILTFSVIFLMIYHHGNYTEVIVSY